MNSTFTIYCASSISVRRKSQMTLTIHRKISHWHIWHEWRTEEWTEFLRHCPSFDGVPDIRMRRNASVCIPHCPLPSNSAIKLRFLRNVNTPWNEKYYFLINEANFNCELNSPRNAIMWNIPCITDYRLAFLAMFRCNPLSFYYLYFAFFCASHANAHQRRLCRNPNKLIISSRSRVHILLQKKMHDIFPCPCTLVARILLLLLCLVNVK